MQAQYSDNYVFQTLSDDGVKLWVNGVLAIDNWSLHEPTTNTSNPIALVAGQKYDIVMWYFEKSGGAVAKLMWKAPTFQAGFEVIPKSQLDPEAAPVQTNGTGNGLKATYYWPESPNAKSFARDEQSIDFDWGAGSPDPAIPTDLFSARYVGYVQPRYTGWYSFYTYTDDGAMLFVDGKRIINNWTDHSPTENRGQIQLEAGKYYRLTMQYYENQTAATARLMWSSMHQVKEVIPMSQLYKTTTTPEGPTKSVLVEPGGTLYPFGPEDTEFLPIRSSYPTSKAAIFEGVPYWRKDDGNLLTLPSDVRASIKANGGWSGVIPPGAFFGPDGCDPSVGVALIPPEAEMETYLLHFSGADRVRDAFFKVGFAWTEGFFNTTKVAPNYEAVICGGAWQPDFLDRLDTWRRLDDVVSFLKDNGVKITAYLPLPGFAVDENGWVYWTTNPAPADGDRYER